MPDDPIHQPHDKQAFARQVNDVNHPQLRSTAMTLAQQLRQEGRQEGRQQAILANLRLRLGDIPQDHASRGFNCGLFNLPLNCIPVRDSLNG